MNILIIGAGGREHALGWKVAQNPNVETVFVAPGNAGTALEPKLENVNIAVEDIAGLVAFAQEKRIELTIVGPETPLVLGVVDAFRKADLPIFGPTQAAAQLEGSKAFTKDFLARHHIPTGAYANFTEIEPALAYVRQQGAPIVVKADGLAAGKGVIVAMTLQEAEDAIQDMLAGNAFGDAGSRVVIEEFLDGEEASFIVMVDGVNVLPMATSQDHKRVGDKDTGPNTGGMGAYSPAPVVTPEIHERVMQEVIYPTVRGMAAEGNPYTGFLYAGLMIDAQGTPKVIEYNCRFGDPETQPIMMRMQSDLVELCFAALEGKLDQVESKWDPRASIGIVLAAGGYPADYAKGDVISGLPTQEIAGEKIFHAGTSDQAGEVVTNGGRVLCATALGNTVSQAQQRAYQLAKQVNWDGMFYRSDIGYRAIAREQQTTK
jgi:phosphoribosylamine--glycine ligase